RIISHGPSSFGVLCLPKWACSRSTTCGSVVAVMSCPHRLTTPIPSSNQSPCPRNETRPAGRAALNRDVTAEIPEHLLHLGRQYLQRLAGPILAFGADLVGITE